MSAAESRKVLQLPSSLEQQLLEFRRRVWLIKSIEAVGGAVFGVVVGYLAVYCLDRLVDTPAAARLVIFLTAMIGCALLPVYFHRWIWRMRTLDNIARLVSRRYPSIGDQMLGVIELVRNEDEQNRSLALCQAAIGHGQQQRDENWWKAQGAKAATAAATNAKGKAALLKAPAKKE